MRGSQQIGFDVLLSSKIQQISKYLAFSNIKHKLPNQRLPTIYHLKDSRKTSYSSGDEYVHS